MPSSSATLARLRRRRLPSTSPLVAIRLTKRALNNWVRLSQPIFEASPAMEMPGFMGEDVKEGIAAPREKCLPRFPSAGQAGITTPATQERTLSNFQALQIEKSGDGTAARIGPFAEADLMDGDVDVNVAWSSLNYKDGLAVTGRSPVVRRFPMIAGIDLAGTVSRSSHPDWRAGDQVVCNGWGLGETHLGAYAEKARVKGEWLVRLPAAMTPRDAMAIGTAGYTAMLAVMALEDHGLAPGSGPVVVTGAAGGVGSIAVAVLGRLGHHVVASTGRPSEAEYLRGLGAAEVVDRAELSGTPRALGRERWAGGIDSVGSTTLANVLSTTRARGAVAACGLAGGMDLPSSVAPFILRGVTLVGIDSVMCPIELRRRAWDRLAKDLDMRKLAGMTEEIALDQVPDHAGLILDGHVRGRIVVRIG